VDKHNHARQSELSLEKHWLTQNAWFRLVTTVIGITVTDAWKAFKYSFRHGNIGDITIRDFADSLAFELMNNDFTSDENPIPKMLSPFEELQEQENNNDQSAVVIGGQTTGQMVRRTLFCASGNIDEISSISASVGINTRNTQKELLMLELMSLHPHAKTNDMEKTGRRKRYRCSICKRKTSWFCSNCNKYVCADKKIGEKNCYRNHILQCHPSGAAFFS
jgi:hypothetical protein